MRPLINVPEDDRVTYIGNMHKKLAKTARVVLEISSRTDRQTNRQTHTKTQTDILITIHRNRSRGRSRPKYTDLKA